VSDPVGRSYSTLHADLQDMYTSEEVTTSEVEKDAKTFLLFLLSACGLQRTDLASRLNCV